ncbi:MAG: flavin monoamine oxidase family protein [Caldilineaceae bacterium]
MDLKATGVTRRQFLRTIAAIGGSTAVWATLDSWALAKPPRQELPQLDGPVEGVRLIILGAGMAGMTMAYELGKLGYDIEILEVRDRPGGHNWTIRRGAVLEEFGGERQVCDFDEGQYFNPGPWRIPHHHEAYLHYCRELNVPVEPFINYQEANYVYVEGDFGPLSGRRMRYRELDVDMRGYTAELLAKFADNGQLDDELTGEHVDQLVDYLVHEGLLDADTLRYTGSHRRGYVTPPGAGMQPGQPSEPFAREDLIPYAAEIRRAQGHYLASAAAYSQQMTMMQPVGGMDRTAWAFAQAIGEEKFSYQTEVREIRQDENGVRIVCRDLNTGETREVTGDYCVSAIPLTILSTLPADFTPEMSEAIRNIPYVPTGKIGLQFSRRFWEEDDRIFGGVSRTNISTIGGIAYPSYGFLGAKGVLQGYYNFGTDAIRVSNMSVQARIDHALEHGSKIHPQYRETFENGFSVAWHRVPFLLGGWPSYNDRTRELYYPRLLEPDGRIYLAGEYLSYLGGWIEGTIRAAWLQMDKLHQRVRAEQEG